MRVSEFPLFTLKENPAQAEVISHRLMLRAGLIRNLASGLYVWMPLGLRCLQKVTQIIQQEMTKTGAIELSMPIIQPAKLWRESGRWDAYGAELLRINDRHNNAFVVGPTHEEVITDMVKGELTSYRQLPLNFYQIQTKFRDEIRPRFGVMRAREFLMKDGYSFHIDDKCLAHTYNKMFDAYVNIFNRLQLNFKAVRADGGVIGGKVSHEFHVLAESGEDAIAFSNGSDYAANVEMVPVPAPDSIPSNKSDSKRELIDTPNITTIESLSKFLDIPKQKCLKAIFVKSSNNGITALFLRGDHTLNAIKTAHHPQVATPLTFADKEEIIAEVGCPPGSLGPIDLKIPVIIDYAVGEMTDFSVGANIEGKHFVNVNWNKDLPLPELADLRNIESGEPSPDGKGTLEIKRGIEVGHIFQLGDKYSKVSKFTVLNENGVAITPQMGCYGIGVSRVIAATIEQSHDDNGIIWPLAIAPFSIMLTPIQYHRNLEVKNVTDQLYQKLIESGIEVLLDDRDISPGIMFSEADLIGIPYRLTISPKSLKVEKLELKHRENDVVEMIAIEECIEFIGRIVNIKR